MAAGKTFESKLGKQYYPVALNTVIRCANSFFTWFRNRTSSSRGRENQKFTYSKAQWVGVLPDLQN